MAQWQTQFELYRRDHRVPIILAACLTLILLLLITQFIKNFRTDHLAITATKTLAIVEPPLNLAHFHLFGIYDTSLKQLPNTPLQLILEGTVVFANDPTQSRALISSPNQPAKVYQINDTVPGNAKITRIEKDFIVVDDNGSSEKLALPIDSLLSNQP